jgi:hypothetical protein
MGPQQHRLVIKPNESSIGFLVGIEASLRGFYSSVTLTYDFALRDTRFDIPKLRPLVSYRDQQAESRFVSSFLAVKLLPGEPQAPDIVFAGEITIVWFSVSTLPLPRGSS